MRPTIRMLLAVALLSVPGTGLAQAPDAQTELEVLRANAERGNPGSQYALGLRYANGVGGVERDPTEALRWYRLSGEQGHVTAQFAVAAMYDLGVGVAENAIEAARWYEAAALQGHAAAQHNLAVAFETGQGVGRSEALALEWYEEAAQSGLPVSIIRIAEMYAEGVGGEQNLPRAAEWYQVGAVQGDGLAQVRLGQTFAEGRGIDTNDRMAYLWLEVAVRRDIDALGILVARDAAAQRLDEATRAAVVASVDACGLSAYYYCGDPIAPPCALSDAHRSVAVVLEPGAYPDIERPQLVRGVEPQFPVSAVLARGRPGDVVLDALLLADGRVGPVCVRQSLGPTLDAAAVRAATLWEFTPAARAGMGVPVWVRLELSVRAEPDPVP
jgi:TonB family protein